MYRLILLFFLLGATIQSIGQSAPAQIDQFFQSVRPVYSPDSAFTYTKFVAEQWRLPGNKGFDKSIYYVKEVLERAGFEEESEASSGNGLTYRIERYPLDQPAWEPVGASLEIQNGKESIPVLSFPENRNLIAINSFSTPAEGVEAELVYVSDCSEEKIKAGQVKGKIVMGDCHPYILYRRAVVEGGAIGILCYLVPPYNQPERYSNNIPFRGIPYRPDHSSWGFNLSYAARNQLREQLEQGPVTLKVKIDTRFDEGDELTLIADIKGKSEPEKRVVLSAHVQEPGANDNASGVGCLAEMARTLASLIKDKKYVPQRTMTFIWGDEIAAPRRYLLLDEAREKGVVCGLSLDMVGENTELTGGTFLIEKMPDPSAIWTRGEDKHTEWGAGNVNESDLFPHYFNDLLIYICRQQGKAADWEVNTNPFEGGSDHMPFLNADIPGVLFWHFTDVFYHTDGDLIDKVSPQTLYNVGVSSAVSAMTMASAKEETAQWLGKYLKRVAVDRLKKEVSLSAELLAAENSTVETEKRILDSWTKWYLDAMDTVLGFPVGEVSKKLKSGIETRKSEIGQLRRSLENRLRK